MAKAADWEERAKGLLKAELKRRGVTYNQLVEKLARIGVTEAEPNVRNKLARGKFTAVFPLAMSRGDLEPRNCGSIMGSDGSPVRVLWLSN